MTNREAFKRNLNYLIDMKGYKQIDIANWLGISRSTVSRWCDGTSIPSGVTLVKLAECLSVAPSTLTGKKSTFYEDDELELLQYYRTLSKTGKTKALERMYELSQLYWYDNEHIAK